MNLKSILHFLVYLFAIVGFVLVSGFFAVKFGLTNTPGIIDRQKDYFTSLASKPEWANGEEWNTFAKAVVRDEVDIESASKLSEIPARLIVAQLVSEQLRLFHTNREIFKTVFAPLQLLGNQSQFSWGVMGIKQETARAIEDNLKDENSAFYPGKKYEHLLDFKTAEPDKERFERITNEQSRFYSYLYAGLYLKEIVSQWQKAGFPIDNRPEILSTLFNIGFEHSQPKKNPQTGGSELLIAGKTYSFGRLGAEFYYSDELISEFPI